MYKKPDGSYGVSFTRFMNNSAAAMMIDSTKDPGHISLPQRDRVYLYQLTQPDTKLITAHTLDATAILDDNIKICTQVFQKLQKIHVVGPRGELDTTKIGANFTHDLAQVGAYRQKQLIDFMFWWEEEVQRLKKLEAEKDELENLIAVAESESVANSRDGDEGDQKEREVKSLRVLLERLRGKIATRPSARVESVERDEDEVLREQRRRLEQATETLPGYSA